MTKQKRDTWPRTACPICLRDVAVDPRHAAPGSLGTVVRHLDGHETRPEVCPGRACRVPLPIDDLGTRETHEDVTDNGTTGISGFPAFPKMPSHAERVLGDWWRTLAEAEIEEVVAKAVEYGATDLRDLGLQILEMAGRKPLEDYADYGGIDIAYATEVGIAFYAMGKMARIAAAIKEGRRPSYDSWHDLGVYARMAQRVHEAGGWPAIPPEITARRFTTAAVIGRLT